MDQTFVTIHHLAAQLGVHPSNARKIVLAMGLKPERRQIKALGHYQRVLCLSRDEADLVVRKRRADGFDVPAGVP